MPAAEAHFIGRVRGVNGQGLPLEALELEHYPAMAERRLQELAMVTAQRAAAVLVRHRIAAARPSTAARHCWKDLSTRFLSGNGNG
jgi:molybdopterin synthase catalytic subunit